jgi:hypothetical protein
MPEQRLADVLVRGNVPAANRALVPGMAAGRRELRAVRDGRIVVDEPVDLPDGAELRVYLYDAATDAMSPEERAALGRALERSIAQADAGELIWNLSCDNCAKKGPI